MGNARDAVPFARQADFDAALPHVLAQLESDRLVAHPTETVYGIGSSIGERALERLQHLKERAATRPFILLIASWDMLDTLGLTLTDEARQLAGRHWPGALTLVLRGTGPLPSAIRGADGETAVRWTSHTGLQQVICAWGAPMTSTSANRPGLPPATTVEEIQTLWSRDAQSGDLLLLNGGALVAAASTIVDCSAGRPRLVRHGSISANTLRETVPDLVGEG